MTQGLPLSVDGKELVGELTIADPSLATTLSYSSGTHNRDSFIGTLYAEEAVLNVYGEVTAETVAGPWRGMAAWQSIKGGEWRFSTRLHANGSPALLVGILQLNE